MVNNQKTGNRQNFDTLDEAQRMRDSHRMHYAPQGSEHERR
jgi:hypothetical protein